MSGRRERRDGDGDEVEEHEHRHARHGAPGYGEKADPEQRIPQVEEDLGAYLVNEPERPRNVQLGRHAHDLQGDVVDE